MSRHLLLCTLGASWAVIPEVYGFLAPERLPLYRHHPDAAAFERARTEYGLAPPEEIWVCTTQGTLTQKSIAHLRDWTAQLPMAPVLRIWQAADTDELASQAECDRFRELLLRVCLLAESWAGDGQRVLSLAGGRKTMSADLQWAGTLLGCSALLHVVGLSRLPDALAKDPEPALLCAALPTELVRGLVPVVTGDGRRSELLDVDLDGAGPVGTARFPVPLPGAGETLVWQVAETPTLVRELRRREQAGSQLLGNYLAALVRDEHHENWRSLYRLPPRLIDTLRQTPLTPALRDFLVALPKADLHRHLGGCLDLADQQAVGAAIWAELSPADREAAQRVVAPWLAGRDWPEDWPRRLKQRPVVQRTACAAALLTQADPGQLHRQLYDHTEPRLALRDGPLGFAGYERPGELSGSALLSHPAALAPYARAIVRQAAAEGLAYLELRGSPQKYGDGGAFLDAFHAVLMAALNELPDTARPRIRFIVIVDRRQPKRIGEAVALALQARERLPDFVAGLDLAGDESQAWPTGIADAFLPAFEACLPLTIHAGEGEAASAIWQAAYHLHADRIGHGLSLGDHPGLAARFRDRGICLELCPTSNREVVGFRDPDWPASHDHPRYPLPTLWEAGLPLTLCTDNPGISRTTLADEYLTAARLCGNLSLWDALAMIQQGFVHAFLPGQEREALRKQADARIYQAVLACGAPAAAGAA